MNVMKYLSLHAALVVAQSLRAWLKRHGAAADDGAAAPSRPTSGRITQPCGADRLRLPRLRDCRGDRRRGNALSGAAIAMPAELEYIFIAPSLITPR